MDGREAAAFVAIEGVSRAFGSVRALRDVSLTLGRGEIVALLGPSGCGKSTLLRIVAGLEQPDAGTLRIDNVDVTAEPPYRRPVNLMFQSYALFPHLSVAENVAFGLRQAGWDKTRCDARVAELLSLVRMADYGRRRPAQLSGGQQQRVALARSLARSPKLLLLDEPMGALDRKLRAEMQFELAAILRAVQVTCMLVTHDPEEAMVMADRVVLMRDGIIVQAGSPQAVYDTPCDRFAAEFLGAVNALPGTVAATTDGMTEVDVPALGGRWKVPVPAGGVAPGRTVTIAVRPERLALAPPGDGLPVTVIDRAFLGTHTVYRVTLPDGSVGSVQQPEDGGRLFAPGEVAALRIDAAALRLLAD
jgi:putrescine transport system ATP-binding protein